MNERHDRVVQGKDHDKGCLIIMAGCCIYAQQKSGFILVVTLIPAVTYYLFLYDLGNSEFKHSTATEVCPVMVLYAT